MIEGEYIIVGLGLAGCAMAEALIRRDQRIFVIHDPAMNSSSRVAAGLYNPITGRKMVKTWKADLLFPYLEAYYDRMEKETSSQFLEKRPIYRPFVSMEEQNDWAGRSASPEYAPFVEEVITKSQFSWVADPNGGILLKQAGYLRTHAYLDAMYSWITDRSKGIQFTFDPHKLKEDEEGITYDNWKAKKIIFCEGTFATQNPWFSWLPFRPVKGEILDIDLGVSTEWIVNRGVFMLDLGEGVFRVGSTYNNHDATWELTEEGLGNLTAKLEGLVSVNYTIEKRYAGVRPASKDRRPMIGLHPEKETFVILNGLGTKGVSLSPYYADQLAGYLGGENDLDSEVNINRYFSLY